jgi:hypothetical protein
VSQIVIGLGISMTARDVPTSNLNPHVWIRYGRGKGVHFRANDDDIVRALTSGLPQGYAPYVLLATSLRKVGNKYESNCEVTNFDDIPRFRQEGVWNYFLGSLRLTALPNFDQLDSAGRWLATNGLINLQHGRTGKKGLEPSSVGIVDKVRNTESGEIRTHSDYLKIYKGLAKLIRSEGRVSATML